MGPILYAYIGTHTIGIPMSRTFYGGTDSELLAGANNFATLISATPSAFSLVAAQATAYAALNTAFASAYASAINPSTRTKIAITAKNTARKALVSNTLLLAEFVLRSPTVSNAQKESLGLKVKTPPSPVPAPSSAPLVDFISAVSRTVRIRIHDGATPKRAKPAGVKSATIYSFVGPTAPPKVTDWKFEGNANKAVFDITFPDSVANGALVWVAATWNNAKNQSGPPSDPISINIPGGGLSMAA